MSSLKPALSNAARRSSGAACPSPSRTRATSSRCSWAISTMCVSFPGTPVRMCGIVSGTVPPMKFVVAGYGSRGDVEPCIAVARELLRRGHDVVMAVTVPPDMLGFVESTGLTAIPYGRDWDALLADEDFVRMMQNPMNAVAKAVEFISQVHDDKSTTLTSVADGADLLVAGITEQGPAANVAEYYGIPLAALHFFPAEILESSGARGLATRGPQRAQRQALGLP